MKFANACSLVLQNSGLFIKKHAPEITLVTGITATVAGTVLIARAATKQAEIIENHKAKIAKIHETDYPTEDGQKKALTKEYTKTAGDLIKIYAPGVVLEAVGLTSICLSHGIMKQREKSLIAAYTGVTTAFAAYRDKIKKLVGEEAEQHIYNGDKDVTATVETTDEDGVKKKEKRTLEADGVSCDRSLYSRMFKERCRTDDGHEDGTNLFCPDSFEANYWALKAAEIECNKDLQRKKVVFLNDVYQRLGFTRTDAGQVIGWTYYDDGMNQYGDNRISFGLEGLETMMEQGYPHNHGVEYLVTFNVDRSPVIGHIPSPRWRNGK